MAAASPKADPQTRLIRALRLRAQGLAPGTGWATAPDVARAMVAMQAQDGGAVRWALSLRAADSPSDGGVLADLAAGRLARNRPSRGTLQVTAPDELHWLSSVLTARSIAAARGRRGQLGLTDEVVDGAEAAVRGALAGGVTATRPELVRACAAAGIVLDNGQAGHVLRHLTELMVIVFADPAAQTDTFALADHWIPVRRSAETTPAPPAALAEVVTRFVTARGPVTRRDIGRWTNLTMTSVHAGVEAAGPALERVRLAETDYLVAPGTVEPGTWDVDAALAAPLLLPAFDEYLIGYGDRSAQLRDGFLERIVPGRNGMFKPIVVIDGEIVGTWSRRVSATGVTVTVEPFTTIGAADRRRLAAPVRDYGTFLGRDAVLR